MPLARVLLAATVATVSVVAALAAPLAGEVGEPPTTGVASVGTASIAADAPWQWPITPLHPVARPYLAPPTAYAAGHRGIDIRAPAGTAVLAPADGVVHFAGVVVDRPVLSIAHPGDVLSSFEPVQTSLVAGDVVRRGQVIGILLDGHCTNACLHLGARVSGEYVNPLLFLGGMPWSVLLPAG